ncbi:hypothetical protein N9H39_01525 [Gammaproteobacteria bacterium]|nr:hypothetical protein [Gammaproteobacteria bacterium]
MAARAPALGTVPWVPPGGLGVSPPVVTGVLGLGGEGEKSHRFFVG